MSYFRSYFEKNNTVLKKSYVNTAKNPTTEIFYGTLYSKLILTEDLTDLIANVDNGDLVIGAQTKHYLKFNTFPYLNLRCFLWSYTIIINIYLNDDTTTVMFSYFS
jgi:hypothetical protein